MVDFYSYYKIHNFKQIYFIYKRSLIIQENYILNAVRNNSFIYNYILNNINKYIIKNKYLTFNNNKYINNI